MASPTFMSTSEVVIPLSPTEAEMALLTASLATPFRKGKSPRDDGQLSRSSSLEASRFPLARPKSKIPISKWLKPRLKVTMKKSVCSIPAGTGQQMAFRTNVDNQTNKAKQQSEPTTSTAINGCNSDKPQVLEQTLELPASPSELRRLPVSYRDLRSFAARQEQLGNLKNVKLSPMPTPLLPSPVVLEKIIKDLKTPLRTPEPPAFQPNPDYTSYEDMRILSCYCDDGDQHRIDRHVNNVDEAKEPSLDTSDESSVMEDCDYELEDGSDDNASTASESMPITPTDKSDRDTICSTESDWLANTVPHMERLRRFKARCFQVVQHPMNKKAHDNRDGIMLATVLIGPGKPKLVEIQRPSSLSSRDGSRREHTTPTTPEQNVREVSAFSPYDTPGHTHERGQSDVSRTTQLKQAEPCKTTYSCNSLVPPPLQIAFQPLLTRQSTKSQDSCFSGVTDHLHHLSDPFGSQFSEVEPQSNIPLYNPDTTIGDSTKRPTSLNLSPTLHAATVSRHRNLDRTLCQIQLAIDAFPHHLLALHSPLIRHLQYQRRHSADISNMFHDDDDEERENENDKTFLFALQKIFTQASTTTISLLAAWLMVDIYLSKVIITTPSQEGRSKWQMKAEDLQTHLHHVVGMSLLETLRGKWDGDIWMSLVVLVEVISKGQGFARAGK